MRGFLRDAVSVVARRLWVLAVLNWLLFGLIFVGNLLGQAGVVKVYTLPFDETFPVDKSNAVLLFGFIFFANLIWSGFVLVTLTGLAFFGLSLFFLSFRAFFWGVLLSKASDLVFLVALPTLALEGEGYVLAALAGVNLGLAWLRPDWAYREGHLSRSKAIKKALEDCGRIYVLVAIFLFVAAAVETITLVLI